MKKALFFLMTLMALSLSWGGAVKAQTTGCAAIGEESTSYGAGGYSGAGYMPIDIYYKYSYEQMVYDGSEMPTAITSICFKYKSSYALTQKSNVDIYLGETTSATLSSWMPADELTLVYSGALDFPASSTGDWVEFTFNQNGGSFSHDQSKYIVVVVNDKSYDYPSSYSNMFFCYQTCEAGVHKYLRNDNNEYSVPPTSSATNASQCPIVRFCGTFPAVSCEKLSTLTATVPDGYDAVHDILLQWTGGSGSYNVQLKKASQSDDEWQSLAESFTENAILIQNQLDPMTTYDVRVQSVCSGEVSNWKSATFTTDCGATSVDNDNNYTYGFEEEAPFECWTVISGTITRIGSVSYAGTYRLDFRGTTSNMIAFPAFTNATNTLRVEFWTRPESNSGSSGKFAIGYMTDINDASTFVPVETYNSTTWASTPAYVKKTVDLISVPANATIAFCQFDCSTNYYWYVDDVTVKEMPSCVAPTALAANASTTSAELSWTANSNETAWTVYYKKTTDENYTEVANATNPYTLPNLTASTNYQYYVVANCTAEDVSEASEVFNFATECDVVEALGYTENFDSYTAGNNVLPTCWNYINTTTYSSYAVNPRVYTYSTYANTAPNCLYFYSYYSSWSDYDPQPQYAILPEMDNLDGKQITLSVRGYNANSTLKVGRMTDPSDASTFALCQELTLTTSYQELSVELTGTGNYIALMIDAATSSRTTNGVYVDDITVENVPSCKKPSALTLDSRTAHTATLHWTNGAATQNAWQIAYSTDADFDPSTVTPVDVTTNPATIEGLAQSTTYYAYVRANCGNDGYSAWNTIKVTFSTLAGNVTPTGLAVAANTITSTEATASWNAVAGNTLHESYDIYWAEATFTAVPEEPAAPNFISGINTTSQLLSGLTAETEYKVWVRDNCGNDGYSAWSSAVTFTTASACQTPDGLAANSVTNNSATLSWNAYGQTGFNLQYRVSGEEWDANNIISNVNTPYSMNPILTGNTTYQVRVQATCTADPTSDDSWSNVASFTTACDAEPFSWSENFDNWTSKSVCWSFRSGQYNMGQGTPTTNSSAWTLNSSYGSNITIDGKALTMNLYSTYEYWAVTPAIDITTDDAVLKVDVAVAAWSSATPNYDDNDTLAFAISTDGGNTFTNLRVLDGDDLNNLGNDYTTIYVPVAGYNGQAVRFAIYGGSINNVSSSNDNRCVIDNVSVEEAPSCYPVGTLAEATDITPFSAKLSWGLIDNTQDGWRITYATNAELTENMHAITVTSHENYTLSGLTPETHYYVAVCAFCGAPGYGAASNIIEFTTGIACPAPTNLEYDNASLTQTSVDLSWTENGTASAWKVAYKAEDAADFSETMVLENPYTLGGLTQGTNYTVKVRAICGGDYGNSQWSDEITFMTVASCPAPTNLAVTDNSETAHGATITWEGEAPNFIVEYGVASVFNFSESFDGDDLPDDWSTTSSNWSIVGDDNAGGTPNEVDLNWDPQITGGFTRLITPAFDLSGMTSVTVSFKHMLDYFGGTYTRILGIATSSDNGTTWNTGWSQEFSSDVAATTISQIITTPDMGMNNVRFCIYFQGDSYGIDDWYFDDIVITGSSLPSSWTVADDDVPNNANAGTYTFNTLDPETTYYARVKGNCGSTTSPSSNIVSFTTTVACPAPTNLAYSSVTAHTADLTWNRNGNTTTEWEIDTNDVSFVVNVDGENPTYALTGLKHNRAYAVKVRAHCDGEAPSAWSNTVNFTTDNATVAPTLNEVTEFTNNTATISWTGSTANDHHESYELYYATAEVTAVPDAPNYITGITELSTTINDLTESTNYNVWVRDNCGNDGYSAWAGPVNFTTKASCSVPENLAVTPNSETAHGATLTWTAGQGNDSYVVEYGEIEAGVQLSVDFEDESIPADFTNSANYPWTVTSNDKHEGTYSVKSGGAGTAYASSDLKLTITLLVDGSVSFWAKASSEGGYDYGRFFIDGTQKFQTSGTSNSWTQYNYDLTAGSHTLLWRYYKDSGTDNGDDCFYVDSITIIGGAVNNWLVASNNESNVTYTFDDLDPETSYQARVKGMCGESQGGYSNVVNFTTLESCPTPTIAANATNIGSDEATIDWTSNNDHWDIYYSTVNTAPDANTEPNVVNTTDKPYTLTGLTATTTYYAWVRTNCGNETSAWSSNYVTFTTKCSAKDVPYTYDFETADDFACWTPIAGAAIANGSNYAHNSTYYLKFSGTTSNMIALPQFNEATNNLRVEFWTRPESKSTPSGSYYYSGKFAVGYMTDITDASTFVAVETYNNTDWAESLVYVKKTVDMVDVPANATIAMRQFDCSTSYYWFVDDITVKLIPSCEAVSGLTVVEPSAYTVALSWTPGASQETNWKLQYRENGYEEWNTIDVSENDLNEGVYTLDQLSAETTYNWQVAAACSNTDISEYTAGTNFTTLENCPKPTNLTLTSGSETAHGATLTWTPGSTANEHYIVEYHVGGDNNWSTINNINEPTYTFTTLEPETYYEARVSAVCGIYMSDYCVDVVGFTTLEACPKPAVVTTSNVTANAATISWNGTSDSYTVSYRTAENMNVLWSEGFEDESTFTNWTRSNTSNVSRSTSAKYSDNYGVQFTYTYNPPLYLISPDVSAYTTESGLKLEFYYSNNSNNYTETFYVGFSSTNTEYESFDFGTTEYSITNQEWKRYFEDIPTGTKYIAIKYTGNNTYNMYVDDFVIGTTIPAGGWQTVNTTETSTTLTDLTPETTYEAKVQGHCANEGDSEESELVSFTPSCSFYQLLTDASDLAAGDKIIIAAATYDKAMSTTQNTSNHYRGITDIIKNGNRLGTPSSTVQILTLEEGTTTGTWALNTGNGYLKATSSSSNYLDTQDDITDNASWTITVGESIASIVANGTYTNNTMRYNNSSTRISCYSPTNSQYDLAIYKLTDYRGKGPDTTHTGVVATMGDAYECMGQTFTASGDYEVLVGTSTNGCDSIRMLHLTLMEQVKTPTFSPVEGEYNLAQNVEISCETADATIHYTTDGSVPTAASAVYSQAITVEAGTTVTIKAIAMKEGMGNSEVATATYTVTNQEHTITFNAGTGTCTTESMTAVSIEDLPTATLSETCAQQGWAFYGWSESSVANETTEAPVLVSTPYAPTNDITLYAVYSKVESQETEFNFASIATANNWTNGTQYSSVTIDPVTLTATGGGNDGKYYSSDNTWRIYSSSNGTVTITSTGGTVTAVSSNPSKEFTINNNGVASYTASENTNFKSITVTTGSSIYYSNPVCLETVATPTFNLAEGSYSGAQSVEISCATEDATIYYTLDGTEPSTSSTLYGGAIAITETATLKAIAVKENMNNSAVAIASYTIVPIYTVTLDAGNGSLNIPSNTVEGNSLNPIDLSNVTATLDNCDGWNFAGWSTSSVSETTTAPTTFVEELYYPTADVTLYAVYQQTEQSGQVIPARYVKVTSDQNDWSGDYLIVCENVNKAFNGNLTTLDASNNNIAVTIDNGIIESNTTTDAAKFIIAKLNTTTGYSIKSASGYYIGSTSNSKNELLSSTSTQYSNTISVNSGNASIQGTSRYLRYNNANNDQRFRYYTSSSQQDIQLYKYEDGTAPATTTYNSNPVCVTLYTITATADPTEGGTVSGAGTYDDGTEITLTATASEGYHFVNWTKDNAEVSTNAYFSFTVTEAAAYVANFAVNSYNVTLNTNNGTINSGDIDTYTYGVGATLPSDVTLTGNTFGGWYDNAGFNGDPVTAISTTETGDKEFWAKWTANSYNVTLNTNNGTINSGDIDTYTYGVGATLPSDVTLTGYTFDGWYDNAGFNGDPVATISTTETGNKEFWAKWTVNDYTVTLNTNNGTINSGNVTSYTYGVGATLPTDVTLTGYTFDGWYDNAGFNGNPVSTISTTETGDKEFWAKWTANSYNVTLNPNNGTINSGNVTSYTYGAGATLPTDVTLTGNTFGGWYDNEECTGTAVASIGATETGDKVFWAKWSVNNYTVTLNTNGGTINADNVTSYTYGIGATLPTDVTKEGHTFGGWYNNATFTGTAVTSIDATETGNKEFWAKWNINSYAVSATANPSAAGTITGAGTYSHGAEVTVSTTVNTGFSFVNWTENGNVVSTSTSFTFTFTGARTLVANFDTLSYNIAASANPNAGGTVEGAGTYKHFKTATLTATAATGYTFVNWTEGGQEVSTNATYEFTVTGARELVANFELNSYEITATSNPTTGGTVTGAGTYNHFASATLTATPANGYHFVNWTESGNVVSTNTSYEFEVNGARDLVANFAITPAGLAWSADNFTGYTMIDFNNWKPTVNNPNNVTLRYGCVEGNLSSQGGVEVNATTGMIGDEMDLGHIVGVPGTYRIYAVHDTDPAYYYDSVVYTLNVERGVIVALLKNIDEAGTAVFADYTTESTLTHSYSTDGLIAIVAHDQTVRVQAEPVTGYHFSSWQAGNNVDGYTPVSTDAIYTYTVPNIMTVAIKAVFDTNTYALNVVSANETMGIAEGSTTAKHFLSYQISATPNTGYHFTQWSDGNTQNPRTVTLTENTTYTAEFAINSYNLTINYKYADGTQAAATHTESVNYNAPYSVTSPVLTGYTADQLVVTGTMGTQDVELTVTYSVNNYTLTILYQYTDGTTAAPTYTGQVNYNEIYSVSSPEITGYTASQMNVSGTMPADDVTVDVTYYTDVYTLTVHYVYADNTPAAEDEVRNLAYNVPYTVTSPTIEGYTPDQVEVSGTMGEADVEVTVVYSINSHNLTVNYVNEASAQVAESHTATLNYHDNYSVVSPQVAGYAANKSVVSGTMGDADKTETVTYYLVQTSIVDATNCAGTGTGSLTVTAPLGSFEYSLDGVTFQTEPQFANLNAGDYTLYIRPTGEAYNYSGVWTVNSNITMPVAVASSNPFYCLDNEINLSGNGSSTGSEYTYAWSGPNNFTANDINATIPEAGETHSGTYTLTVTNTVTNCVSEATVDVIVNTPNMNGYLFTIATHGDAYANLVNGDATPVFATPTVQHYLANAGCNVTLSNDAEATYHHAGDYTITWTAEDACGNTATTTQVLHVVLGTCPVATDYDGNTYPVVALNNLCWMAANLRTTHYSDSRPVPNLMVYSSDMYPDATANLDMFGYLYDWTAAMDAANGLNQDADGNVHGICPAGWRMPKENEIRALVNDGVSDIFDLRTADQWLNNFGTNTTGFSLLPAGCYNANNDRFENLHGDAYIWGVGTSTPTESRVFWADCKCYNWQIFGTSPLMGFSVRCVKEN